MVEDEAQQLLEVSPRGGTLVVFESNVVPHEVTPVVSGERLALFGFFAEERPIPRAWRDPEGCTRYPFATLALARAYRIRS